MMGCSGGCVEVMVVWMLWYWWCGRGGAGLGLDWYAEVVYEI